MSRKNKTAPERCAEIYKYIKDFLKMKGYPPSVREIGEKVGLSSSSTVHSYLHMLEADGKIHRDPTKPRAIEIIGENPWENMLRVPLVGKVAAGIPITAEENIEEVFNVPASLLGTQDDTFMLRVQGESMINAGIYDGDYIFVKEQNTARNGEIVVALVENEEATVKRIFFEKNRVKLQPENDTMKPFYEKNVAVLGKVIGVYRQM
ncbi:MAG: transcriptional repressor LexA [Schwartzia sp.]|jgi:repressor LexA|nr:transcriptional repressor LexA [Schwartzia sp. (in: firmicutes)]MBO6235868.1 transcriptional repressor LexA [Schwartzia sp. (in: firmicutes)]MBP3689845.1 transcriptional repressor LexA [Schwartzia sp. (in: firmicutes)]